MGTEDVKVTAMNMYKYKERLRTSTRKGYVYTNVGRVALIFYMLNFVYYNFLFRYTLTKTMRLNRASASVYGELINVAMLQLCSSMEFITWVGLMLSVHGKNGMHLIFLRNLLLKCFLQQSQDIQPYFDNQIKEIAKSCIQNSERMESSLAYAGC